ncbi:Protein FREE1 [Diplonema papillatum]|nr:Protein FREE1 [Diplonema papillatum]
MAKGEKDRELAPSPVSMVEEEQLELQVYPKYATVGDFSSPPVCVHKGQWKRDSEVSHCPLCAEEFSLIIRRHHCRVCAQIFCNACSAQSLAVRDPASGVEVAQLRACDHCFANYQQPVIKCSNRRNLQSLRGSTLGRLKNGELFGVFEYLPVPDLLRGIGSTCRALYFKSRESPFWERLPAVVFTSAALVATASEQEVSDVASVSPSAASARNATPPPPPPPPQAFNSNKQPHPLGRYQTHLRQLLLARQKSYKSIQKHVQDVVNNPVKIALVGPTGVGKTALTNSFLNGGCPEPCGMETVGAAIRVKRYRVKPIAPCNPNRFPPASIDPVSQLHVVDCGGNPRYRSLLPIYLAGHHVVVICIPADHSTTAAQLARQAGDLAQDVAPYVPLDTLFTVCVLPQHDRRHRKWRAAPCLTPDRPAEAQAPTVPISRETATLIHSANPRIAAVTSADPYTNWGVKDVFRTAVQVLIDRVIANGDRPEKRPVRTPLSVLVGC